MPVRSGSSKSKRSRSFEDGRPQAELGNEGFTPALEGSKTVAERANARNCAIDSGPDFNAGPLGWSSFRPSVF